MRISDANIALLVANEGELPSGPINSMGVLRLALDLQDARRENAELRAGVEALGLDMKRIDWIGDPDAKVDRIDRVQTYWFEGVDFRDAVDSAMNE